MCIAVFFSACGVDTSSSPSDTAVNEEVVDTGDTNSLVSLDLIDSNLVIENEIPSENNSTDTNNTDNTNTDDNKTDVQLANSTFDTVGAIEDRFACILGDSNDGYTDKIIKDDSFDPTATIDQEYGIGINSRFDYNDDPTKSQAAVYYTSLKTAKTNKYVSIYETDYRLDIDTGWANNDEKVIYVRTPKNKNDLYGCYRYDLSNITVAGAVRGIKVYRNE
jgi:hypothetical protein